MGRGPWQATVHGVAKRQTQLKQLTLSLLKRKGGGNCVKIMTPSTVRPGARVPQGSLAPTLDASQLTQKQMPPT